MFKFLVTVLVACLTLCQAAPNGEIEASGQAQVTGTIPQVFSFDKGGNVGVNFMGFKASAGLGGLLTGNSGQGGLHAEAGTPFGHGARAGILGNVEGTGQSAGSLYADATAGGDLSTGAGLAGTAGSAGAYGVSYAGISKGGFTKGKVATTNVKPVVEVETQKEVQAPLVFQKHIEISAAPVVNKEVEVVQETQEVKPQKTYIERTVIPRYQEKTIYVPSYVEKTVRVPTVIEKKVKVPVEPTVVEKRVDAPPANVHFEKSVEEKIVEPQPVQPVYVTKVRTRPFFRKHFYVGGGGYGGAYGGGYGGDYYGSGYKTGNVGGTGTVTVRKSVNPDFINNIFNIPISTLGAVSKLVGGIVGGTSGSLSVSKSAGFSTY